jgi:amidohydrolase
MIDLKRESLEEQGHLSALRREFHRHPELGLHEYRTASRIEEELDRIGIPHTRVGETGVLGILAGADGGNGAVALRADIDALPIQETHETEYTSTAPGIMHACGHDAHAASLLGAARLLAKHREQMPGEVRFIFQPAEEIGQGAKPFIEAGALDGVDRIFGLHTAYDLPVGTVGLKPGLNNAAVDHFSIQIKGKAAHVSTPQLGADALYIASQLVVGLQAIATRRTSPVDPVVIGIGKLAAGTAYNAVAESALLEGTTRTVSQEQRYRLRELIDQAAKATAAIYGGTASITWTDFTPPLINDPRACSEAAAIATDLGAAVVADRALSLSGDNFAEYQLYVPGAYAYVGTGNPNLSNTTVTNHNGDFDIDEAALPLGAALLAAYAIETLQKLAPSHQRSYKCPPTTLSNPPLSTAASAATPSPDR